MSEDDRKALKIAHEAYGKYWSTEFHYPENALQSCMDNIKKCVEVGDEIGTKVWLIIMLSPAMLVTSSISGVKKYFDILEKESEFIYTYDEEAWSEIVLTLLESHIELMKIIKSDDVNLEYAESALRYLLMETTDYYTKLKLTTHAYALGYMLPLEISAGAKGLKLNDVITVNKTIYSAIRRSKRAMGLVGKDKKFSPSVETFMDFASLLAIYNIALSAGFISYRDAKLINLALTEGNFEVHGSLEKVSLEDTLDLPEVESGDVDFGDN